MPNQSANPPSTPRVIRLLGVPLDNLDTETAISDICAIGTEGATRIINFANPHCLNLARTDPAYRQALLASDRILPDGSGIRLATTMRGETLRANLNGTDLFPDLCAEASRRGLSIFLLGARPGLAEKTARNMQRCFPGLKIAGCQHGYFPSAQSAEVVDRINGSGADLLFVAQGVPRQELWLQAHRHQLQVRTALGVGGLFDYYSGRIPRAPRLWRRLGVEWLWRLRQEPGRLWRRYVLGNPMFVARIFGELFRQRLQRAMPGPLPQLGRMRSAAVRTGWRSRHRVRLLAKRALDIGVSGSALLLASPLLLLIALAIRLESRGPALFVQNRVGAGGRNFRFYKFRSMYIDAEQRRAALEKANEMNGGVIFKMRDDPRVTRVGRLLRRSSLDELPQLWNVLRGDMSLVGPRPALPDEVRQYSVADRRRLDGAPGITCEWQVSGRSEIPFAEQVALDVGYLHRAGLRSDIGLLLRTVPAVISGRGAY